MEPQHSCDGEMAAWAPQSACVEVAGLGLGGILIALGVLVALGVIGWFLWRRVRDRDLD